MESSWDRLVPRTSYHFDPFKIDPAYDAMRYAGRFTGDWSEELAQTIKSSEEITWRNRNPKDGTSKDIKSEEYDLVRSGADADLVLTNLEYDLLPVFQRMTDALSLVSVDKKELQTRVHIQQPGQVWNLHIDKLEKFNKALEFSESVWSEDEFFFEADLLLGLDSFVKKDYKKAEKYFERLNKISR